MMISTEAVAATSRSRAQRPTPPYLGCDAGGGVAGEDDDQPRGRGGNKQIARPEADAAVSGLRRGRGGTLRLAGGWGLSVVGNGLHLILDYPRLFAAEAAGRAENGRAVRLG